MHGRDAGDTVPDGDPAPELGLSSQRRLRSHHGCGNVPCRAMPARNAGPRPHKRCSHHNSRGQRRASEGSSPPRKSEARTEDPETWDLDAGATQAPRPRPQSDSTGAEEPPPAGKPAWRPAGPRAHADECREPAPEPPAPGVRGAPHGQEAALTLPGCSHGDLKARPKQEPRGPRAKTPVGVKVSSSPAHVAQREDTSESRATTCFGGHADHALLLLPEADVVFKRQEIKK